MRGSTPLKTQAEFAPLVAAMTAWGSAGASAPKITSAMRRHVCVRHATAAGACALTIDPSGAVTRMAR